MPYHTNTIENCVELAQNRDGKFLSEKYINAKTKYEWQCVKGHKWFANYNNVQQGQWCPECYLTIKNQWNEKNKNTLQDCNNLAKKKNGKFLSLEYVNAHTKCLWQCELGHTWLTTYDSVFSGTWCPNFTCQKFKKKKTYIKKYGVDHSSKNKTVQNKAEQTNLYRYSVAI